MTEPTVTVTTAHGPVTIPLLQAEAIVRYIEELQGQGKKVTWHRNNCECCFTVHEDVEHPTEGYIIGKDGGVDWVESEGHEI